MIDKILYSLSILIIIVVVTIYGNRKENFECDRHHCGGPSIHHLSNPSLPAFF